MKLLGSKMEQDFREELTKSHEDLFNDQEKQRLLDTLKIHFPEMRTAYVVGWTPEQGEDIYRILINIDTVAGIEIDRFDINAAPLIERISILNYKQGLSKIGQIKLAVAIDLAKQELNSPDF